MGVPKFFRYISERYPCLSELIKEYQIPAFDNLYLDMNGIIHMCSHPDDSDPTFRITEEKIFQDVFHYIEILFRMIKPQKVFFMAVDGVAPRAKMNQQRGRRFRSAREVEKQESQAKEKKTDMPTTARFDSNCITPGTIFMTKLHDQLKYFVSNKVTTDKLWQKCTVILSGHETPGEGEHKIMDYIRYSRSQPGYDPNTRHCLYGLDADLVMLGLVSHEPHFSLLREEVKFGKKSRKVSPENTTFYLLHLSLMREYLREEFKSVIDKISFKYNLECIIDDWVLMGFLVGNDFIPHLPNLHINSGALPLLYKTYIEVLPELDGYLNESGTINLKRFHKFLKHLTEIDYKNFEDTYDDLQYFKSKTGRAPNSKERKSYKPQELEAWDAEEVDEDILVCLEPANASVNKDLAALIRQTDDFVIDDPEEPSITELSKIFLTGDDEAEEKDMQIEMEFQLHKKNYYETKLHLTNITADTLILLSYEYIRALQWILNYYYNGVCSWSWYYPYHYAPYISDIKGFLNMKEDFDIAKPFLPYEQLLAVLPPGSKDSLPKPFHSLMTDLDSPIKDFYPDIFETDLNGKRQEWEAVVLIPFIDEDRLINAMALALTQLSPEERSRNSHGPMLVYNYCTEDLGSYYAPEYFPTIQVNHALCTPMTRESIYVPRNKLVKGICEGAAQGVYYPGFPTTKHLEYKSALLKKKVRVFDQASRDYNMIFAIQPPTEIDEPQILDIAADYLHKTVFVRWPHLIEAKVVAVSSAEYRYNATPDGKGYNVIENLGNIKNNFGSEKSAIEEYYMERRGVDVGPTNFLIHVRELVGRRYEFLNDGKMRVNLAKEYAAVTSAYPSQTVVKDINAYDDHHSNYQQLSDLFPDGAMCFMLGHPHYGTTGKVIHCEQTFAKGRVKISTLVADDPNFTSLYRLNDELLSEYYSQHSAATRLSLSYGTLARITSTVLVGRGASTKLTFEEASKANVGLNLKNTRKNEGVPGYVKSIGSKWYYSEKCLQLIDNYRREFFGLFQFINSSSGNGFPFEIDIFPNDKGDGTTLKKIQEWLSKQPHSSIEMQNCDSKVLETEVVQEIETVLPMYYDRIKPKQVKMTVRPHVVYIPGIVSGNVSADNSATFELFDRVINVRECYTVPVGHIGTIIAVHKVANDTFADEKKNEVLVDVLYDKAFAGGLSLNGCLPNRGYRMSPKDLINKSHGNRMLNSEMEKKTPNYKAYIPEMRPDGAQSSAFATWNNSHFSNNYNDNQNAPLHVSPQKWKTPITTFAANIPMQIQRQAHQPMFTNTEVHNPYIDKPQTVAYNAHNIPMYVPPPEPPSDRQNTDSNSQYLRGTKSSVTNAHGSPSKQPLGLVQRQEDSPVTERQRPEDSPVKERQRQEDSLVKERQRQQDDLPSKEWRSRNEEAQMKTERPVRQANNQPGTEMLRNLLRINEKENRKIDENLSKVSSTNSVDNFFQMAQSSRTIKPETQRPPPPTNTQPPSTSSFHQQSPPPRQAAAPPPPQQQSKEFPSAQLLAFFISHGMGCPMYTYCHIHGGCKAEVKIPTNQDRNMVVVSDLCGSIDAATQNVALKTLDQLKTVDLSIFMPEVPPIPNPPKQWCTNNASLPRNSNGANNTYSRIVQAKPSPTQQENWRTEKVSCNDQRSPRLKTEAFRKTDNGSSTSRLVLNPDSVPFVPLQVTRKHRSAGHMQPIVRNSTDRRNNGEALTKSIPPQHKILESVPNFEQVSTSSGQQKPKVARQMRLAANFRNMPIT